MIFLGDKVSRKRFLSRAAAGIGALAFWKPGETPAVPEPAPKQGAGLPHQFSLIQTLPIESDRIRGLAWDEKGNLLLADSTGLKTIDLGGNLLAEIPTSEPVTAVAAGEDGACILAHRTRVRVFDRAGKETLAWGEPGTEAGRLGYVTSLVHSGGNLFVADAGNRRIARFAANGDLVDEMTGFHIPSAYFDCGADAVGNLVVGHTSEHRIERYDRQGDLQNAWGQYGDALEAFCGCCNPTNLAVFPDGRVVTGEKGIPRVKLYGPQGELLAALSPEELGSAPSTTLLRQLPVLNAGSLPCHDGWPGMPMAIDAQGRVAISVPSLKQVRLYEVVMA